MSFRLLLLFAVSFSGASVMAAEVAAPSCVITVQIKRKTGKVETRAYPLTVATRSECADAAKAHEPNFAPRWIESKTVTYKWEGK